MLSVFSELCFSMEPASSTSVSLSEKAQKLLDLIKAEAPTGHVGNMYLRGRLQEEGEQWPEDEYWKAHAELTEKRMIGTGRGRGGSVWLLQPIEISTEEIPGLVDDEKKLYEPLVKWLNETWGREAQERDDFFMAKITGSPSGRKRETGLWSRPDVSLVQVNKFDYITIPEVEASSFEVKRYDDAGAIDSVYEAAAHSRWAHNSWLVAEDSQSTQQQYSERFRGELERFGVGLMTMKKQQDNSYKFDEVLAPVYRPPEPKDLDEFLQNFFAEEGGKIDQKNLKRFREKSRPG
jgi:hypothetical protein